jgi:hypothetical protein
MRRILPPANASFNAAAGTITFSNTIPDSLSHITRVTNLDRAVIYFDPTNNTNSGILSAATYTSPVLTLKLSTAGHGNNDRLFIEYDDGKGLIDVEITEPISIGTEIEIKNDSGSPIPTSVAARTPTTTSVASSATSVLLLAANANRKGLSIYNESTAILRISHSNPATATNHFATLQPGGFYGEDQQAYTTGAIYGIWSAANGTAQVRELV